MILILAFNACLVLAACLLPDGFLALHSYLFYGAQLLTLVPYVLRRGGLGAHAFLPTTFSLAYFLVSETLGSILVPRFYGFQKEYAEVALNITHYNLIVPYLLLANLLLFVLSVLAGPLVTRRVHTVAAEFASVRPRLLQGWGLVVDLCLPPLFLVVSVFGGIAAFSLQLAVVVVHAWELLRRPRWYRLAFYLAYLLGMLATSFQSKRQIVIVLFLFAFLEAAKTGYRLRWNPWALAQYFGFGGLFLGLVLVASVLRGYGGFENGSVFAAVRAVPQYVGSDFFIDGLTDNLELNYSYGAGITAIDLTRRGVIEHQYGASIWKVLFLPVPRDAFTWKPESALQVYTKRFDSDMWAIGGSLPVFLQSDMFMNFDVLGLLPFVLIWLGVNGLFLAFLRAPGRDLRSYSVLFLSIIVLVLARGSGLELYLLTYLLGLPILVLAATISSLVGALGAPRVAAAATLPFASPRPE